MGQNLASLQTKIVLASVFKSFRFELQSAVEADYFLTLKAVAAVRVYDANKISKNAIKLHINFNFVKSTC